MNSAPLVLLLLKATLVLAAALATTRTLSRASASVRHLVWLASLGALVVLPPLAAWAPLRIAALPPAASTALTSAAPVAISPGRPLAPDATAAPLAGAPLAGESVVTPTVAPESPAGVPPIVRRIGLAQLLLGGWLLVASAIIGWLAYGWLVVRRIVRRARPYQERAWLDPLYEVSDRLALDEAPRLLRSEDTTMPFACGVGRPTIVLPAESDSWSAARRRAVLLHELAHVRRRDLLGHALSRLVCAAYWFHPLVWTASRRMRAESERACDDLALSCGERPADYAEHLLDIVTSVRRDRTPLVALAMARRSEFEGRMLAILDPERPRRQTDRRQALLVTATLGLLTLVVGAASPTRRPAPAAERDAHSSLAALRRDTTSRQHGTALVSEARPVPPRRDVAMPELTGPSLHTESRVDARLGARIEAPVDARIDGREYLSIPRDLSQVVGSAIASALGTRGDTSGERVSLLAGILRSDTSAAIRRLAAWGLSEHAGAPVASAALVSALRSDRDAEVREMAAWALADGDNRNAGAVDALIRALRGDASPRVRATAAWALGSIGDRAATPALVQALSDSSRELRQRATWALGNVLERQAPPALVAMLRDPDAHTRLLTAWALYNIEDPSTVSALQAAMRAEKDPRLQVAELRALAALGDESVGAIRSLLESPDASVRATAVRALAGGDAAGPWPWPWPQPRPYP